MLNITQFFPNIFVGVYWQLLQINALSAVLKGKGEETSMKCDNSIQHAKPAMHHLKCHNSMLTSQIRELN